MTNPTNWSPQAIKSGVWLNPSRLLAGTLPMLMFVAIILGSNYALTGLPNFKLFDLMVFVAGYTLGFRKGATIAIVTWLIYGNINPFGPTNAPLLAGVMLGETFYAGAGAMIRNVVPYVKVKLIPNREAILIGALALICTIAYDITANIATGISWAQLSGSTDYMRWINMALVNPGAVFFYGTHALSNVVLFIAFSGVFIKIGNKLK